MVSILGIVLLCYVIVIVLFDHPFSVDQEFASHQVGEYVSVQIPSRRGFSSVLLGISVSPGLERKFAENAEGLAVRWNSTNSLLLRFPPQSEWRIRRSSVGIAWYGNDPAIDFLREFPRASCEAAVSFKGKQHVRHTWYVVTFSYRSMLFRGPRGPNTRGPRMVRHPSTPEDWGHSDSH